jgi:hypothetical protein
MLAQSLWRHHRGKMPSGLDVTADMLYIVLSVDCQLSLWPFSEIPCILLKNAFISKNALFDKHIAGGLLTIKGTFLRKRV